MKTILITGSTDGIGLETAKTLVARGHHVLLHGRSQAKLQAAQDMLAATSDADTVDGHLADLSQLAAASAFADEILARHSNLDVLINNAGILKTASPITPDGLDVRFAVNTLAPYLLTQRLLPRLGETGRVVNVSSAAQAPVNLDALAGRAALGDMEAYSQSKLAITMWSRMLAHSLPNGPAVISVNPGSLLASKMVKEGFGIAGNDLSIGAEILARAALDDDFAAASGEYFDNDAGRFGPPHPDALDDVKSAEVVRAIERVLQAKTG